MTKLHTVNIPCPVCNTPIPAETGALISGVQFSCPKCAGVIGMSSESADTAKTAMNEFNKIKNDIKNSPM